MTRLEVNDLLKFAVKIEENGYKFYTELAGKMDSDDIKKLFSELASDEASHGKIFGSMLSHIKKVEPEYANSDEYYEYLEAFIKHEIFGDDVDTEKNKINGPGEAIQYAMKKELASIIFYSNLKKVVPIVSHAEVNAIVNEEEKHYTRLSVLLKAELNH